MLALLTVAGCDEAGYSGALESQERGLPVDIEADPGSVHLGGGDLGRGLIHYRADELRGTTRDLTRAERVELAATKPHDRVVPADSVPAEPDFRARLRADARDAAPGTRVRVLLHLPDREFPWHELGDRALADADRVARVRARQAQLADDLDALDERLARLGGAVTTRFWIVPAIAAEVPVEALATIAGWPELAGGGRDDLHSGDWQWGYYDGTWIADRTANGMFGFYGWENSPGDNGYDGYSGHRYTSAKVRVGVYDSAEFAYIHPAFNWPNGTSRIVAKFNCDFGNCVSFTPTLATGHGTAVVGLAAGNITDGQDPSVGYGERFSNSGVAKGTNLYYYSASADPWSAATHIAVMQRATLDAIDVLNLSTAWGVPTCSPGADQSGFNLALRNATNAGTLSIFSGGNANTDNVTCTVPYPGVRRDGMAIGGLNTVDVQVPYDSIGIWPNSSRGGMNLTIGGVTYAGVVSLIDLAVPACVQRLLSYDGGPGYDGQGCGTSGAAPIVAGSVALVLNTFYELGWSGMDARMTQTYMLMMGTGWAAEAGQTQAQGMDKRSGAGRLINHFMSSDNLWNPWAWACRKSTISHGQVKSYPINNGLPMSSAVKTWKAALTWQEDNYLNAADLDLHLYDTCPQGGGSPVLVASDASRDLRARLRVTSVGGRCLEQRVVGYHVPAGETRTFTVCDYFQSGDTTLH